MKTKVWEKRGKSEGFYRGKSKVKYYREMLYRKTETAQKCCIGLFIAFLPFYLRNVGVYIRASTGSMKIRLYIGAYLTGAHI